MASLLVLRSESRPASRPLPASLQRLYRAHIQSVDWRGIERTAFVEASSHNCATRKIAAAIAALEHCEPADVADQIYNTYRAKELVDEGVSEDLELRLFETGWIGGKATNFVHEPLFLLAEPSALIRKWATIPQEAGQ